MLSETLVVSVAPRMGRKMTDGHYSAEHFVIKKAGSKDPADAIQPTSVVPFVETAHNLAGATIEKQGIVATFPLASLKEGLAFLRRQDGRALRLLPPTARASTAST